MSWGQALQPIVITVPRLKAAIRLTRAGAKINIGVSDLMLKELGAPKAVNVLPGTGENAGRIMIVPAKDGVIAVVAMKKGGARLSIPVFEGVPASHGFDAIPCRIVSSDPKTKAVVAALPVAEWREAIAAADRAEAAGEDGPKDEMPAKGGKVDIEDYLKKKGHRVTRMGAKLFQIDGDKSSMEIALKIANVHRKRADLPPLTEADVE